MHLKIFVKDIVMCSILNLVNYNRRDGTVKSTVISDKVESPCITKLNYYCSKIFLLGLTEAGTLGGCITNKTILKKYHF